MGGEEVKQWRYRQIGQEALRRRVAEWRDYLEIPASEY